MKSIEELKAIREKTLKEMSIRENDDKVRIVVGMATCGIAAGAKPVMSAFIDELNKRNINNVNVTMTGCIGICRLEPVAEIFDANGEKTTYVKLDAEKARRIVAEHIVNQKPVTEFTVGAAER
ncbi:MAG: (2Fe-2S) ferredoxin domain-containing protein [Acetivibrionales bacterium]|jgi:NADP-reducing hydrogenase subunit HndB|nr:(2Fe-2S) ferredoxin domain-containing protein [Clostridiaceae bacterium]